MNIELIVRRIQKHLKVPVDGRAGPVTWGAIHDALIGKDSRLPPGTLSKVDPRSEKNIGLLLPEVRPYARALVHDAEKQGITIKVISTLRSFEEQDALYAKGRTLPGPKVTNARGGFSNHNFGTAFDVGVFSGRKYLPESPAYAAVGALGMQLGLEWGGDWKSIRDQAHFQLRPDWAIGLTERQMLAGFRVRLERGGRLFA